MSNPTGRIRSGEALGQARRGVDLMLGSAAMVPIIGGGIAAWLTPADVAAGIEGLVVVWSGVLLAFFGGVRRGLSFSEAGGARPTELSSMLWLVALGCLAIVLRSAALAALGLACVGVLDVLAARRLQAPTYFTRFRPVQMAVAVVGLGLLMLRHASSAANVG